MRFSANVSILFREAPLLERFARAAEAGFGAVEFWWPLGEDLAELEAAIRDAGLETALFNFLAGDMPAGERGLVSDPRRQDEFRASVPVALALADRLGCRRLNALAGHRLPGLEREQQLELAAANIAWAAKHAAAIGAEVLVEAVNTFENGPYLLPTTAAAAGLVERAGRDNVRLQYDAYHAQRMEGNLVATLRERADLIGHVQLADSPARGEPGSGEINFRYVLGELERLGYDGYLGLEYNPTTERTEDSLGWLPRAARSGEHPVSELRL